MDPLRALGARHIAAGIACAAVMFIVGYFITGVESGGAWSKELLDLPPFEQAVSQPAAAIQAAPFYRALLTSADGAVEGHVKGGSWSARKANDEVEPGGSLRTGTEASATLRIGEHATLTLLPASRITRLEPDPKFERYTIDRGQVEVECQGEQPGVWFGNGKGEDAVFGCGSRFMVFRQRKAIGVTNTEAKVELRTGKTHLEVPAGTAAWTAPGQAPEGPIPLTQEPELTVESPESTTVTTSTLMVRGQTHPLAEVRVNNASARVNGQGAFSAKVALELGENKIEIVSRHVTGAQSRFQLGPIKRVRKAPTRSSSVRWGGGK